MRNPPNTKSRFTACLLALCLFSGAVTAAKETFQIASNDVTSISTTLTNRPDRGALVSGFEVPKSHQQRLLNLLNSATPHRSQIDWAVLGEIKIVTKSGAQDLTLFSDGKNVVFQLKSGGGKYQAKTLKKLLRTIDEAKKTTSSDR